MFKRILASIVGSLLVATPTFAQTNPIENVILGLRAAGFQLVLLWLLALAIVYGILSHIDMPKSMSARSVISIVSAFMVLLAAGVTSAAVFISNLITASIVIAFGLMMVMIFLEITGTKMGSGEHVFTKHPRFFATALIILLAVVFVGAGGLNILNIQLIGIAIPTEVMAIALFLTVMVAAIWVLMKETGGK